MRKGFALSLGLVICLAIALVVALGRISDLQGQLAELKEKGGVKKSGGVPGASGGPVGRALSSGPRIGGRLRSVREAEPGNATGAGSGSREDEETQNPEEMVGQLIRALMQTDAGRKMALEESVEHAETRFAPLLADFAFSDEERAHFLELAGAELGSEDMLWMGLLMAKEEDREGIMQEWEADREQRRKEMRAFLNDEEDWDRYRNYRARVPEYEQMDGLREVMMDGGVPLSEEQEARLVDILYAARMESGMHERWEGRGVLQQLSEPGIVQRLRDDWKSGVATLGDAPRQILSARQAEIFEEAQAEMMEEMTEELSEGIRFLRPDPGLDAAPVGGAAD